MNGILDNVCDVCDALLSDAEIAAGVRFGQTLCNPCAAGYAAVNPDHPDTPRSHDHAATD